jgi:hypothetical protein
MKTRIRGTGIALAVLSLAMFVFGGTPGAVATQGQAVIAGQLNTSTDTTELWNQTGTDQCGSGGFPGLVLCGSDGLQARSSNVPQFAVIASDGDGVWAAGSINGLDGKGGTNGVYGQANNSTGSGVYGQNDGSGYGVAGRANNGTGVFADSTNGTALLAQSSNGVALSVEGLSFFSRAGIVAISYPNKSATVSVPGAIQPSSLVLATVQNNTGVYVKFAVPKEAAGTVVINLNKAPGSSTNPKTANVAWFVLNYLG